MDKPLDARVQRTRSRLHAALLALLAERRLDDISVADIVDRAEVGYATFFRHYADKQALWSAVADELIADMHDQIQPCVDASDHAGMARQICDFVDARRDVYRVLLAGGASDYTRQALVRRATELSIDYPRPRASALPETLGSTYAVNALFSVLAWWLDGHDDVGADVVASAIDRLIFAPLFEASALPGADG